MKKLSLLVVALMMMLSLVACGGSSSTEGGGDAAKPAELQAKAGEGVALGIPESGWYFITSTNLNGAAGEAFVFQGDFKADTDIQYGGAYLQIKLNANSNNAENYLQVVRDNKNDDVYGAAIEPFTTGDITWEGRESMIVGESGGEVFTVGQYGTDWKDPDVQTILGSIKPE